MKKKKILLTYVFIFCLTGIAFSTEKPDLSEELMAGIVKIDITPPVGIKLASYDYWRSTKPSQGIVDSLDACVLVLDANGVRVGIISCDLIGYRNKKIIDAAKERFNIPHLLICSSHSHSTPDLNDEGSKHYSSLLEESIINGLDKAVKNMFPAKISAGYATFPQLGFNRLVMREDGHARAMWRSIDGIPYGPVDPEIGVIKIEDKSGEPRVVLMTYACHPVVNFVNFEISADYPGVATKKVEEGFGNGTICMFVQGGAGDIDPLLMNKGPGEGNTETDYELKEKMGTYLANEAVKLAKSLSPNNNGQTILRAMDDSLKFTGRFDKALEYNVHFTTILVNDIAIATMHAEPFVEFQLSWKKNAEVAHPFFFGYTYTGGDYPGYIPDIRSAAYGGYGADDNIKRPEVGAGEAIMNKHLENLYRLKGVMRDIPGPK